MKNFITYRMYNANSKTFEFRGFGDWTEQTISLTNDNTKLEIVFIGDEVDLFFNDLESSYFSKLTFNKLTLKGRFEATLDEGSVDVELDVKDIDIEEESILLKFVLGDEENTILISRSKHYDN